MNSEKPILSFGVVADLQYCEGLPFKNRYFAKSKEKLKKAVFSLNQKNPDFVINLGDTIDKNWQSFDEILPLFKDFNAPVYHVLGNHDYEVEDDKKSSVHTRIGIERYYQFSVKNWRFVVLDGNEISTFANPESTPNYVRSEKLLQQLESGQKINANFWNGGIGNEQLSWLEKILSEANKNHEKIAIFCHYPIFPDNKHNLLNTDELLTLIKKYKGVKMWINGHNHKGNYGLFENIHFINMKGMVEGENDVAWSVVQLYDTTIRIIGYGNEISATLSIK